MNLIKERGVMDKDKLLKGANDFVKKVTDISKKITQTAISIFEKVVSKMQFIDPEANNRNRVISALILLPVAIYAIFYSENLFFILALTVTILMTAEWLDITKTAKDHKKWLAIGFVYILVPIYSIIQIRLYSAGILFWMFSVIWATDIFAFFSGKVLGGEKIAPHISPNKTWNGLIGGIIASMMIGFLNSFMFNGGVFFFIFISAFLSVVEQIGDLTESKIKRTFGVKDSGNIIPGHGGVMDRLDGILFVAPIVLLLVALFPGKFLIL